MTKAFIVGCFIFLGIIVMLFIGHVLTSPGKPEPTRQNYNHNYNHVAGIDEPPRFVHLHRRFEMLPGVKAGTHRKSA